MLNSLIKYYKISYGNLLVVIGRGFFPFILVYFLLFILFLLFISSISGVLSKDLLLNFSSFIIESTLLIILLVIGIDFFSNKNSFARIIKFKMAGYGTLSTFFIQFLVGFYILLFFIVFGFLVVNFLSFLGMGPDFIYIFQDYLGVFLRLTVFRGFTIFLSLFFSKFFVLFAMLFIRFLGNSYSLLQTLFFEKYGIFGQIISYIFLVFPRFELFYFDNIVGNYSLFFGFRLIYWVICIATLMLLGKFGLENFSNMDKNEDTF